jgi:hypothetical protein
MARVQRYGSDRTNQKLYFAKQALKVAADAPNVQKEQMAREEVVFHLVGVYGALLAELGYAHGMSLAAQNEDQIVAWLENQKMVSPELEMIRQQKAVIDRLQQALSLSLHTPKRVEQEVDDTLIMGGSKDPIAWLPKTEELKDMLSLYKELVAQMRESMIQV